jgi:hypothetical protein
VVLAVSAALAAWGLLALVAAGSIGILPTAIVAKKPQRLMLVYVGADDCAPCRTWRREAASTLQSPGFARLVYREVDSPSVLDLRKDDYWPSDLRGLRAQLGPDAGVPLWLVIADGAVVGRGQGISAWRKTILPKLQSLL